MLRGATFQKAEKPSLDEPLIVMKNIAYGLLQTKAQLLIDQRHHAVLCHLDSAIAIDYIVESDQNELRLLLSGQPLEKCLSEMPGLDVLSKREFTDLVRSRYATEIEEILQGEFHLALGTRPSLSYQCDSELCSFKSSTLYVADLTTIYASLKDLDSGTARYFKFNDSVRTAHYEIKRRIQTFLNMKMQRPGSSKEPAHTT